MIHVGKCITYSKEGADHGVVKIYTGLLRRGYLKHVCYITPAGTRYWIEPDLAVKVFGTVNWIEAVQLIRQSEVVQG